MELKKRLAKVAQCAGEIVAATRARLPNAPVLAPLKKLGLSAPFEPSAASIKVYKALIADKVAQIDRLPAKYREEVQDAVWKFVMKGFDSPGLARELEDRFGIVPERARLIATAQCKMARAIMENARRIELGSKEAVWRFDASCATQPPHRALDGKRYALAGGANLKGKRLWPGSEPDCCCTSATLDAPAAVH
jgi:uncharacterized protein with gpF-like domain